MGLSLVRLERLVGRTSTIEQGTCRGESASVVCPGVVLGGHTSSWRADGSERINGALTRALTKRKTISYLLKKEKSVPSVVRPVSCTLVFASVGAGGGHAAFESVVVGL